MDLLRLTLAHQPLSRLTDLPVLLRSKPFCMLRARVANGISRNFESAADYFKYTAARGELIAETKCVNGTDRAAFLRDSSQFEYYMRKKNVEIDIWYALSVREPEIIKLVCERIRQGAHSIYILNDTDAVQLTPELKEALTSPESVRVITEIVRRGDAVAWRLAGLLDLPINEPRARIDMARGRIRDIIKKGEEYLYNKEAEDIVGIIGINPLQKSPPHFKIIELVTGSAYLYPLIGWIKDGNKATLEKIAGHAWWGFKYEALVLLAERGFRFSSIYMAENVTRSNIQDVEKMLADPRVVEMLKPEMVDSCKILLGYIVPKSYLQSCRNNVMNNQVPSLNNHIPRRSLQSLIFYNPRMSIGAKNQERSLALRELFRTGAEI